MLEELFGSQPHDGNRGASLRFGTVCAVDEVGGGARVKLSDADEVVTDFLRILQRRTLNDQEQYFPEVGEEVAVLFSGQGFEAGVILGALYSGRNPAPGKPLCDYYRRFSDGTELSYAREAHLLSAHVRGDASVRATGTLEAEAEGRIRVVSSGADVFLESPSSIRLTAPNVSIQGNLTQRGHDGGAGSSTLLGSLTVKQGGIEVPDQDVKAGSVSLRGHRHISGPDGGSSSEPVGGA